MTDSGEGKAEEKAFSVPIGVAHLSECMSELPQGIFHKGRTGGGGTTIALTNNKPTIIAVPLVELIINKIVQSTSEEKKYLYPHKIIGIYFGSHEKKQVKGQNLIDHMFDNQNASDLANNLSLYLKEVPVPKIMVTYDSLRKVIDCINTDHYHLLVDEYHLLFTEYCYRGKATRIVMDNFKKFATYTFMTSTPLPGKYLLPKLKGELVTTAIWPDSERVTIRSFICTGAGTKEGGINDAISRSIGNFLSGRYETNAYFFVNSIDIINDMILDCNLNSDNCRVVYSKSNNKKLKGGIQRGSTMDDPKKINFITAASFDGADIYDEEGRVIIVSDGELAHTLLDISTRVQQIAGRIRDTKHYKTIDHIYSLTRNHKLTEDGMEIKISNSEDAEKEFFRNVRFSPDVKYHRESFKLKKPKYHYLDSRTNEIIYDPLRKMVELFHHNLANTYESYENIIKEHAKYGYDFEGYLQDKGPSDFEATVRNLEYYDEKYGYSSPFYEGLESSAKERYPFIMEAIERIKYAGIAKMNYRQDKVKEKLDRMNKKAPNFDVKVAELLNDYKELYNGAMILAKRAKEIISEVYRELGITKKATANHLNDYYHITANTKRLGGKPDRVLCIGEAKFNLD
ncbi:hypothetical protein SAMN05192553_102722 [Cyclobacterium xiamenense]|uniref:Uncharacterized protein n=1 Tax=Cyclobacterium xiamenense TaxID=1297121 RepID=A0A1H6WQX3_9BACT|nr:hypothetical protein [Cyclobacterium xiamenense]SEJ16627.1 hypothetical protein SAMN05192553_102722 [Cyclobacterium xiamenense]